MELTKNEKKALKILIENAKSSDSFIASQLKISNQAVGKIRKKLERTIINSYLLNLNLSQLEIKLFALTHAKITSEGLDKGQLEIEEKLEKEPNIIQVFRLPSGDPTHIILYAFKDMSELDNFFSSEKKREELHKYLETKEIFTFSNHSIIKNSSFQLIKKIIDNTEIENKEFSEIEKFKKKFKK